MKGTWYGIFEAVLLLSLLGVHGCGHDILGPSHDRIVAVEYRVEGGIAGSRSILRIAIPDTVHFQGLYLETSC